MQTTGTGVSSCIPYAGVAGNCANTCSNGTPVTMYNAGNSNEFETVVTIQTEIITNGPITATMNVYQDFSSYTSGIYTHQTGSIVGAQSVVILGWGVQSGNDYWICSNSLGTSWGIQGYFWIAFGSCGIEFNGIAGMPGLQ